MMSLSRAFAYAGCPNIITSLWKAEDRATASVTQRLHYYLGKNETEQSVANGQDRFPENTGNQSLPEIAKLLGTPGTDWGI